MSGYTSDIKRSLLCPALNRFNGWPWLQVSCIGQMLCAVVADTREHAKRGAAAVKISYEDLPDPIFTIEVSEEETRSGSAQNLDCFN